MSGKSVGNAKTSRTLSSLPWTTGFFFPRVTAPSGVELVIDELVLRPALPDDYLDWFRLRQSSRAHLTRWEPDWRDDETTRDAFLRRIRADQAHIRAGRRLPLLIFRAGRLVGGISLADIRMGNRRSADLGYWIGEPFIRQGIAKRSVLGLLDHAFHRLELNRLEAACQPGNTASRALLNACGFKMEGVARDYLKIGGQWRDHEIWATTRIGRKVL